MFMWMEIDLRNDYFLVFVGRLSHLMDLIINNFVLRLVFSVMLS